jgi:hypothetical protein
MPGKRSNNASARRRGDNHRGAPPPFLIAALGWTRYDAVVFVVVVLAVVAILVNGLFMQSGSLPAPLFRRAVVNQTAQRAVQPAQATSSPKVDASPPLLRQSLPHHIHRALPGK